MYFIKATKIIYLAERHFSIYMHSFYPDTVEKKKDIFSKSTPYSPKIWNLGDSSYPHLFPKGE